MGRLIDAICQMVSIAEEQLPRKYFEEVDNAGAEIIDCLEKLRHYEQLEEQGLLLRLPCRASDVVYWITQYGVIERYVASMDLIRTNHIAIKLQPLGFDNEVYPVSTIAFSEDFGETVFLTKAEAEKALEEMEKKDEID